MKILLLTSLISTLAYAAPQIVAFSGEEVSFPAPLKCFFSNTRMVKHTDGLLVNYTCFDGPDMNSQLWHIPSGAQGQHLFSSAHGNLLSDPVSDGTTIYAMENNEAFSEKMWAHDGHQARATEMPAGWERVLIQSLAPMDEGELLTRFTRNRLSQEGRWKDGAWSELPQRGVNFFFAPGWSQDQIVQKVRLGEADDLSEGRPDEIQIRLAPLYAPVTVLQDRDANPSSPYTRFANFSVVNGKRWLVNASRSEGAVVIVGAGTGYTEIHLYLHFKTLDAWPMAIDSSERVILRGTRHDGKDGLWMISKNMAKPKLLVSAGDIVMAPERGKAVVKAPFYNAPLVIGERVYIGVGLGNPLNGNDIGQGILKIDLK